MPLSCHFLANKALKPCSLPVLAMATTSFPVNAMGMVALWMGVGSLNPRRRMPERTGLLRPIFWKEPLFFAIDLSPLMNELYGMKTHFAPEVGLLNSLIASSSKSWSAISSNSFSISGGN